MVTVTWRLIGDANAAGIPKTFATRIEADAWIARQINIVVLEITSTGNEALNRIYGV